MEAARVAASRGHQVHLYEKTDRMGGQFEPASVPPFKGELADFIAWERNELKKLGVQVHLNTELTRSLVQALQPIAVVVATGSTPAIPDIPGITGPNVVSAADVLMGRAKPGRRCLVAGGGMVGAETAGFLATRERDVTVVDMLPRIADDLDDGSRAYLIALLDKWKVEQLVDTRIVEVTEAGVRLETDGRADFRAVDTVVLALGMKPERSLSDDLAGLDTRVLVIGDAAEPRTALEAVREGFEVALGL